MKNLTPGWRSTAFWTTNLAVIAAFLSTGSKLLPPTYAAYCAAVAAALYALSRGIKKLSDLEVSKGWKTSEFAVCVLAVACAVLSAIVGVLPPQAAALCGTIITGAFSLSQGLAQYGTAFSSFPLPAMTMQSASFASAPTAQVAPIGFVSVPDASDPMNPPDAGEVPAP